ncbi:hypothetical protein BHM03_00010010 [Ensete ventricosum]|nr:hypothetical protein BHM03_00010010 [Ensete ventricosum]
MPPRAVVVGWREREAPPPTQLQICEGDAAPFSRPPETSLLPDSFRPKPTCPTIGGATLVTVLSGSHKVGGRAGVLQSQVLLFRTFD